MNVPLRLKSLKDFIGQLRIATAKGYDFRTSQVACLQESDSVEGLFVRRTRRVIFHPREEKRALCPLEVVCFMWMMDGLIEKAPVYHPLVAAQRLGFNRILATEVIKASCQSQEGYSRKLRRRILRACNLSSD